jgi:hypothetical protein
MMRGVAPRFVTSFVSQTGLRGMGRWTLRGGLQSDGVNHGQNPALLNAIQNGSDRESVV